MLGTGRSRAVEEAVRADEGGQLRSERGQDGQHAVAHGRYGTGSQDFSALLHLLAGTNNIGLWKGRQPAEQTVKGIREIAVRLLKRFPETRLILMEVTPYGPDPDSPLRRRQEEINRLLRRLELPRTTILSINGSLLKPDGTFREGMFKDHVHLTEKGYQAWADALLPLLNGEG